MFEGLGARSVLDSLRRWRRSPPPVTRRGTTADAIEAPSHAGEAGPGEAPKKARNRWEFEPGATIGGGRTVLKRLGGGSAYEVFLVWDERLFAVMVAKLLRPDRVRDARALRELRREVDMLKRLAHPGLVRGYGSQLEGDHPHVLLEVVEGTTLGSLIKRQGALPLEQVLPLALHIAAVLHYLATERVVHLDVKPGNIVMSVTPKLIDLSIARPVEDGARIPSGLGTAVYMAPEQCDAQLAAQGPGIGPAADVWGLGATLYHAVSGRRPFDATSGLVSGSRGKAGVARFPQLVDEPEELPRHLPSALVQLIRQMLDRDPAARPAAADVAAQLEALVGEVLISQHKKQRSR
jgi:eukaryotic-like serine/threonine-protein kinase